MKSNESVCAICMPFQVGLEVVREIPTATLISLEFFHTTGVLDTGELCVAWRGVTILRATVSGTNSLIGDNLHFGLSRT